MAFKNLLDENNVSKYELSKKTNIPYSTISDIINDKVDISKCSYDVLHKIASFFEMPTDQLVKTYLDTSIGDKNV